MYEKLGRMVGRSYEETVMLLIRAIKNSEVPIFFSLNGWSFDGKSTCPVAVQS